MQPRPLVSIPAALEQPGWSNQDAEVLHGGRVTHTTYKKSEAILLDALDFLQ